MLEPGNLGLGWHLVSFSSCAWNFPFMFLVQQCFIGSRIHSLALNEGGSFSEQHFWVPRKAARACGACLEKQQQGHVLPQQSPGATMPLAALSALVQNLCCLLSLLALAGNFGQSQEGAFLLVQSLQGMVHEPPNAVSSAWPLLMFCLLERPQTSFLSYSGPGSLQVQSLLQWMEGAGALYREAGLSACLPWGR